MKSIHTYFKVILFIGFATFTSIIIAQESNQDGLTPFHQSENEADVDVSAAIRRKLVDHENLSVNAENIKIITRNGDVTLRGTVERGGDVREILKIANSVHGVKRIDNQLEFENN